MLLLLEHEVVIVRCDTMGAIAECLTFTEKLVRHR